MALLTISIEFFSDESIMEVLERFCDHIEPIAYGYDTVLLRVQNDEIPINDVKIEVFIVDWFTDTEPFVVAWNRLPN